MKVRLAFAKRILRMSAKDLRNEVAMSMDGVIVARSPIDPVDRRNHCFTGETHMWRKKGEAALPELAGNDPYAEQIPPSRALPLWAGISPDGVAEIIMHKNKKMKTDEWVEAVRSGKLSAAVKTLNPHRRAGQ